MYGGCDEKLSGEGKITGFKRVKFIYILRIFMCMKISKGDIVRINKGFGGLIRNEASLDFALKQQKNKKLGDYKKLAYLFRAILVDHPFSDGNKRTAMFLALAFADESRKEVNRNLLLHHILSIASKNITHIRAIEERLKNAIK